MPTESLLITVCVVAMFVVFAAVLFWGDLQTRPKQLAKSSATKRRPF
ncbi:hypothetical protein [Bradyrhizobium icense]|nr:hypothetical protein [Bradyrhizobium icense]